MGRIRTVDRAGSDNSTSTAIDEQNIAIEIRPRFSISPKNAPDRPQPHGRIPYESVNCAEHCRSTIACGVGRARKTNGKRQGRARNASPFRESDRHSHNSETAPPRAAVKVSRLADDRHGQLTSDECPNYAERSAIVRANLTLIAALTSHQPHGPVRFATQGSWWLTRMALSW